MESSLRLATFSIFISLLIHGIILFTSFGQSSDIDLELGVKKYKVSIKTELIKKGKLAAKQSKAFKNNKSVELEAYRLPIIKPIYPQDSVELGEVGQVQIRVILEKSGKLDSLKLISSSGFERLDKAALLSIRSTDFPSFRGQNRLSRVIRFRFELDQDL